MDGNDLLASRISIPVMPPAPQNADEPGAQCADDNTTPTLDTSGNVFLYFLIFIGWLLLHTLEMTKSRIRTSLPLPALSCAGKWGYYCFFRFTATTLSFVDWAPAQTQPILA